MRNAAFSQTSILQFACRRKTANERRKTGMLVYYNIARRNQMYCIASSGAAIYNISLCLSSFLPLLIRAYSLVFRITGYQDTNSRNPDHTLEIRENPVVSLPPSCWAYVYAARWLLPDFLLCNGGGMMRRRTSGCTRGFSSIPEGFQLFWPGFRFFILIYILILS